MCAQAPSAMRCMPSRPPLHYLLAIRDNGILAQRWTMALTMEAFRNDQKTFYAVTRCLEIISEASRGLPQSMLDRHPHLPWRAIMDAGNFYRHEYDNVAEDFVWRTVQQRLPDLLAAVEARWRSPGQKARRQACAKKVNGPIPIRARKAAPYRTVTTIRAPSV